MWQDWKWSSLVFITLSFHTAESVELLSKPVPLISTIMQLPQSATAYLDILTTVNGLWHPHEPAISLPTWSHIGIPLACSAAHPLRLAVNVCLCFSFFLSLLQLLSFVFRTSRCWGNHFRQPNQNHLHIASQRKVLPLHGSFRFMRDKARWVPSLALSRLQTRLCDQS